MKKGVKIPRVLKIQSVKGFRIYCVFNNGETRVVDFARLFKQWKVKEHDPEGRLLDEREFRKVQLRNQTLSWKNAGVELVDMAGNKEVHPYELSPDLLYEESAPVEENRQRFRFGKIIRETRIKRGLSQQELADRSGTSKTYISRIENDQIEPELTTLYKIVELGLGKKVKISIE